MIHKDLPRGRTAGFTAIEVTIAAGLFAMVLLAATSLTNTGTQVYDSSRVAQRAEVSLHRTLQRIVRELNTVGNDVLVPDGSGEFGTHDFTFRQVVGTTESVIDWSPLMGFRWESEVGEGNDGLDNDGDGLVDEGLLVLLRDAGGANPVRIVICRDVLEWFPGEAPNAADDNGNGVTDERGFNMHRTGDVLTIRLAVSAADSEGRTVVRMEETALRLRN